MSDKSHTKKEAARLSRRSFIKGAGAAAAVASLVGMRPATSEAEATTQAATEGIAERIGPDAYAIAAHAARAPYISTANPSPRAWSSLSTRAVTRSRQSKDSARPTG